MTQRQRRRLRRRRGSPGKKILLGIGILAAIGGIALGAAAAWVISIYDSAPALGSLKPIKKGRITQVYAADGTRIGVIHADNIRQPIPGTKIPQDLKDATVAIEDKNFYEHGGIDPEAIVRAGVKDALAGGKPVQGGSTITQQLVRNLYIADPQETIERKINEAHLANDEEAAHSKSLDPQQVPQHRALRDQQRRDGDRRRGRRGDLLLQARERALASRGGDDRRPSPGALRVQPVPQPARRARPPQRRAAGDARNRATSPRASTRTPSVPASASTRARSTAASRSPTSSTSSSSSSSTSTGSTRSRTAASRSTRRSSPACRRRRSRPSTPARSAIPVAARRPPSRR